ncbi:MAG: hypothetical protein LBL39_06845 [Planctomycetaceae bacterium]|jgi:hypothetical protein|nr:hypothetical protein [Planctomycetaceae bacterium]
MTHFQTKIFAVCFGLFGLLPFYIVLAEEPAEQRKPVELYITPLNAPPKQQSVSNVISGETEKAAYGAVSKTVDTLATVFTTVFTTKGPLTLGKFGGYVAAASYHGYGVLSNGFRAMENELGIPSDKRVFTGAFFGDLAHAFDMMDATKTANLFRGIDDALSIKEITKNIKTVKFKTAGYEIAKAGLDKLIEESKTENEEDKKKEKYAKAIMEVKIQESRLYRELGKEMTILQEQINGNSISRLSSYQKNLSIKKKYSEKFLRLDLSNCPDDLQDAYLDLKRESWEHQIHIFELLIEHMKLYRDFYGSIGPHDYEKYRKVEDVFWEITARLQAKDEELLKLEAKVVEISRKYLNDDHIKELNKAIMKIYGHESQ